MKQQTDLLPIIGTQNPQRLADIIFVHGLGGDALSTWHPEGERKADNSWLTWLGIDFNNVGIWSLAYEVEPFRWRGNTMPLADRAINIVDLLDDYDMGEKPLLFITHSMGGLVVKQLLRHAYDFGNPSWEKIVGQTKGIVFLSTPHSGSDIANWLMKYIGGILGASVSVKDLEANDSRLLVLNEVYRNHKVLSQIPIKVYCETKPTFNVIVVDKTSANPGIPGVTPIPLEQNHISIARPKSPEDRLYKGVRKFIKERLTSVQTLWDQLVKEAVPANQEIKLQELDPSNGLPISDHLDFFVDFESETIKKDCPYRLSFHPNQSGYLLLLSKGTTGTIRSVIPSIGFGLSDKIPAVNQTIYIPQNNTLAKDSKRNFTFQGVGQEKFLAIITKQPLNLSWSSFNFEEKVPTLKDNHGIELGEKLKQQPNRQIFYKTFQVK